MKRKIFTAMTDTVICVPIMGTVLEDLQRSATTAVEAGADVVEWRVDHFGELSTHSLAEASKRLERWLGGTPAIATFRSGREGGRDISTGDYQLLVSGLIETGLFSAADIELSAEKEVCTALSGLAKAADMETILSYHNFLQTPSNDEMISILTRMLDYQPTAVKLAVMPSTKHDVLRLMQTALEFKSVYPDQGLIAISMGELGRITRVYGEFFGSMLTFAVAEEASAPGQLEVGRLKQLMELYKY